MRNLIILVILGGLGYFGWQTWENHPEYFAKFLPSQQEEKGTPEPAPTPQGTTVQAGPPPATPPQFVSKIAVPATEGDHPMMPPGQFLVLERTSVETQVGVTAIVPGDTVKLLERRKDGTLKVTNGKYDFVVQEAQLTQDIALARQAERLDFEKRYGHL
jgi:hypothetical protein